MMGTRFEKNMPYFLIMAFLIVLAVFAIPSEGSFGGADDISHYFDTLQPGDPPLIVFSVQNEEEIYLYRTWEVRPTRKGEWEVSTFQDALPEWDSPDDICKVYVWNKGRQKFYIDDLTINLLDPIKGGLN